MTVIRPNSVSGINSITAQANEIKIFKSDGTQGGLVIGGANLNATSGISTVAALTVTGNVSVGGTLTYQDVTNIDSVGVVTARAGVHVTGGNVAVGHNNPSVNLHVKGSASNGQIYLGGTGAHSQIYADNDGVLILNADQGNSAANSYLGFNVDNSEKLRIISDGTILAGGQTSSMDGGFTNLELRKDASGEGGSLTLVNDQSSSASSTCSISVFQNFRNAGEIVFGRENANNWQASAGGAASYIAFKTNSAGTHAERVRITSAGRMGVGCTPETDFQVRNGTGGTVKIGGSGTGATGFQIQYNNSGNTTTEILTNYRSTSGSASLKIDTGTFLVATGTSGTERLRITSDGKMGVGTASPTSLIHGQVSSGSAIATLESTATSGEASVSLKGKNSSGTVRTGIFKYDNADRFRISTTAGIPIAFETDDTERFRIAGDGQATFDKGAPGGSNQVIARFQAESSRRLDIVWHDSGSLMGFDTPSTHSYIFKCGGAEKFRITPDGRCGFNDSTGGYAETLQVTSRSSNGQYGIAVKIQNNSGYFMRFSNGTNAPCGSVSSSGGNSTSFNTSWSDSRRKKNFETWNEEVLPLFKTLEPKKFNFTNEDDGTEKTKGYVAQDVVNKFPEAYPLLDDTDVDDQRYMFNPSGMTVYLMKALQEEIAKREALEARIAALEG